MNLHRQHWWKCNGPCQNRPPFYGLVKRAMNRSPSPNDPWWEDHQKTCGGTYVKIKEPEGYKKGKPRKKNDEGSSKGKDNSAGRKEKGGKSKNIKDMFKTSSDTDDKTGQSVSSDTKQGKPVPLASVKPFDGHGYRLTDTVTINTDAESRYSQREKMLAAAERRRKANEQRGVVGTKRKSVLTSPTTSLDIRKFVGPSTINLSSPPSPTPLPKKPRLTREISSDSDCVILEAETSRVHQGEGAAASASVVRDKIPDSPERIDLSEVPGFSGNDDDDTGAIILDGEEEATTGFKTCPVCGLSNIPAAIINAHVSFCLDEDIESRIVDDDHL